MLMRKMAKITEIMDEQKRQIEEERRMPPDLSQFGANRDEMMRNLRGNLRLAQAKNQLKLIDQINKYNKIESLLCHMKIKI